MSHILLRLGEAALLPRKISAHKWLSPILSRRQALDIRKDWLARGREWPYEHLVPGIPKGDPYRGGYQKGTKRERNREARQKEIEDKLAKMPQMIAEYREASRLKWELVSPVDKLLLTPRQIKEKYLKKKLQNN